MALTEIERTSSVERNENEMEVTSDEMECAISILAGAFG